MCRDALTRDRKTAHSQHAVNCIVEQLPAIDSVSTVFSRDHTSHSEDFFFFYDDHDSSYTNKQQMDSQSGFRVEHPFCKTNT